MKNIFILSLILLFKLSSYSQSTISCSLIEVIANPKKFDNKQVSITGIFQFKNGDLGILFFSKDDEKYSIFKNGLLIYLGDRLKDREKLLRINGHTIEIIGDFSSEKKGFGDYFSGSISNITDIVSLEDALIEQKYIEIKTSSAKPE